MSKEVKNFFMLGHNCLIKIFVHFLSMGVIISLVSYFRATIFEATLFLLVALLMFIRTLRSSSGKAVRCRILSWLGVVAIAIGYAVASLSDAEISNLFKFFYSFFLAAIVLFVLFTTIAVGGGTANGLVRPSALLHRTSRKCRG